MTVVLGDNEDSAIRDIESSLNHHVPIILLDGSQLCKEITEAGEGAEPPEEGEKDQPTTGAPKADVLKRAVKFGKMVPCTDNSEAIASLIHLLVTIGI